MTAALVAALEGRRVILAEASDQVGGTTSTSAGTLWMPGNRHGVRTGHPDSVQHAAMYFEALIGPDDERGRRQAFLDTASESLEYLERRSWVPGLDACGNDAASIMQGSYPGPGTTFGPAIVFGYRIGRVAARAANAGTGKR
jgi:succinate dehydrogenase/fumarate reductase flavoprotein subunit